MNGRKPGGLSFRVVEGSQHLHRQPLVPDLPAPATRGRIALAIVGTVAAAFVAALLIVHLAARIMT